VRDPEELAVLIAAADAPRGPSLDGRDFRRAGSGRAPRRPREDPPRRPGDRAPPLPSHAREAAGRDTARRERLGGPDDPERPADIRVDKRALGELEKKVKKCTLIRCTRIRTQAVFGTGSGRTGVVFVGRPRQREDLQGAPFVGRAGQLLTRIIEAIKFNREDVYITNVIKWAEGNETRFRTR
jgi:DNA polymerase